MKKKRRRKMIKNSSKIPRGWVHLSKRSQPKDREILLTLHASQLSELCIQRLAEFAAIHLYASIATTAEAHEFKKALSNREIHTQNQAIASWLQWLLARSLDICKEKGKKKKEKRKKKKKKRKKKKEKRKERRIEGGEVFFSFPFLLLTQDNFAFSNGSLWLQVLLFPHFHSPQMLIPIVVISKSRVTGVSS